MKPLKTALAAIATLALASAMVLAGSTAAQAYPATPAEVNAVVFTNGLVNDTSSGQEVENETAVLTGLGITVTPFDGGDGSADAWIAALAGQHLLVLPELESSDNNPFYEPGGTPWVSDAALQVIKDWVDAGGYVIINGHHSTPDYTPMLLAFTGKDYAPVFTTSNDNTLSWDLQVPLSTSDPLAYVNGTYGLQEYGTWSDDLKSIVTPIYLTTDGQDMAVGTLGVGSGVVVYIGYDWYPDDEDNPGGIPYWGELLELAASGELPFAPQPIYVAPAAPALAATGFDLVPTAAIAGVLLLAGGAFLLLRRRTV